MDGVEEAKALPNVREISFVKKIGDTLTDIESSTSRIGFVIAQSDTADEAVDVCCKALKQMKIVIE